METAKVGTGEDIISRTDPMKTLAYTNVVRDTTFAPLSHPDEALVYGRIKHASQE